MSVPVKLLRGAPSGPIIPTSEIDTQNLASVLERGNSAGGRKIIDLAQPEFANDAARLADLSLGQVLSISEDAIGLLIKNLGSPIDPDDAARLVDLPVFTVGRAAVIGGVATGTLDLSPISGFGVAADRLVVGPGLIIASWGCQLTPPAGGVTLSMASTTLGPNMRGETVVDTMPQGGFSQTAMWLGTDPNEEVWLTSAAGAPATIFNGFLYALKIVL